MHYWQVSGGTLCHPYTRLSAGHIHQRNKTKNTLHRVRRQSLWARLNIYINCHSYQIIQRARQLLIYLEISFWLTRFAIAYYLPNPFSLRQFTTLTATHASLADNFRFPRTLFYLSCLLNFDRRKKSLFFRSLPKNPAITHSNRNCHVSCR